MSLGVRVSDAGRIGPSPAGVSESREDFEDFPLCSLPTRAEGALRTQPQGDGEEEKQRRTEI